MFLPAANLLVAGLAAAFAMNGFSSMGDFIVDWFELPRILLQLLWDK